MEATIAIGLDARHAHIERPVDREYILRMAKFGGCGCIKPECNQCSTGVVEHIRAIIDDYLTIKETKWTVRLIPNSGALKELTRFLLSMRAMLEHRAKEMHGENSAPSLDAIITMEKAIHNQLGFLIHRYPNHPRLSWVGILWVCAECSNLGLNLQPQSIIGVIEYMSMENNHIDQSFNFEFNSFYWE